MKLAELTYDNGVIVSRTPHGQVHRWSSPLELLEQHLMCEKCPLKVHVETGEEMLRVAYAGVPFWKGYPKQMSCGRTVTDYGQKAFVKFLLYKSGPYYEDMCAFRGELNQFVVAGFRTKASWFVVGFSLDKCVITFRLEDLFSHTPQALRAPMYRVTGGCDDVPYLAKQLAFDARLLIPISQSGGFTLNVVPYTEDEND